MEMREITFRLADQQAVNTIMDACYKVVVDGEIWYDVTRLRNCNSVMWEVKYLHMRGLLCYKSPFETLVKLKGPDEKKP